MAGATQVWTVGDIRISRVVEMEVAGGTRFILPQATPEAVAPMDWLRPHFVDDEGQLVMSIHALVVDTGAHRVLVDTCIGNDKERRVPGWHKLQTRFLDDLTAAGYPPERIDTVLCTHLHVDHVGWNTRLVDGQWVPTFPDARYLFARTEWEHWDTAGDDPAFGPVLEDSVRPVVDAGLADLVDVDHQVCPGVRLRPTPGHTPGHVSVAIESNGERALVTGDCIHHPCQMQETTWSATPDTDPAEGIRTRDSLLGELAGTDTLVIGTHFATPTAGHVRSHPGGGWWLDVGQPGPG